MATPDLDEDDSLEIGMERNGMVLVCLGDDWPDQFADWLEPIVAQFRELSMLAEEIGLRLIPKGEKNEILDAMDFCDRLSIEFFSKPWTGTLISGVFQIGWIEKAEIPEAVQRGRDLLADLRSQLPADV